MMRSPGLCYCFGRWWWWGEVSKHTLRSCQPSEVQGDQDTPSLSACKDCDSNFGFTIENLKWLAIAIFMNRATWGLLWGSLQPPKADAILKYAEHPPPAQIVVQSWGGGGRVTAFSFSLSLKGEWGNAHHPPVCGALL